MSRGNHESENMNKMYGFEGEVKSKYSANMADLFTEVYNWLPLAHNINNRILVMHGGLFSKVLLKFFYHCKSKVKNYPRTTLPLKIYVRLREIDNLLKMVLCANYFGATHNLR